MGSIKNYRATALAQKKNLDVVHISFIVRSGAGWEWAVEQARERLEGWKLLSVLTVEEVK